MSRNTMKLRTIQTIVGLAFAFVFLAIALYRVPLADVQAALAGVEPRWLVAAIMVFIISLSLRAWRWQIILRPVAPYPYSTMAKALLVGYGLNTIMPARLGELFRAEFFKNTSGLSRVWGLTSIVIERLFDGLTVVTCLGVGLLTARASKDADILIKVLISGGALFGLGMLAAVCLAGSAASRVLERFPKLSAQMRMVQQGFGILRTKGTMQIAALTLVIYVPEALTLWCLVRATGMRLGVANTLVLVGAASLSTLVPSGPAFIGPLQFAYAVAIEFAGGTRALGIAAATLAQLCVLLPIAIVGTGVLVHGSRSALYSALDKHGSR